MAAYERSELLGAGTGWAVLPLRAQRAIIVTEAWSVTRNPAKEESSTRKRCEPTAAEMSAPLGSNPGHRGGRLPRRAPRGGFAPQWARVRAIDSKPLNAWLQRTPGADDQQLDLSRREAYGPHGTWFGGREKAPAAICRKVIEAAGLGLLRPAKA
jgi:hypothetical protein